MYAGIEYIGAKASFLQRLTTPPWNSWLHNYHISRLFFVALSCLAVYFDVHIPRRPVSSARLGPPPLLTYVRSGKVGKKYIYIRIHTLLSLTVRLERRRGNVTVTTLISYARVAVLVRLSYVPPTMRHYFTWVKWREERKRKNILKLNWTSLRKPNSVVQNENRRILRMLVPGGIGDNETENERISEGLLSLWFCRLWNNENFVKRFVSKISLVATPSSKTNEAFFTE